MQPAFILLMGIHYNNIHDNYFGGRSSYSVYVVGTPPMFALFMIVYLARAQPLLSLQLCTLYIDCSA